MASIWGENLTENNNFRLIVEYKIGGEKNLETLRQPHANDDC